VFVKVINCYNNLTEKYSVESRSVTSTFFMDFSGDINPKIFIFAADLSCTQRFSFHSVIFFEVKITIVFISVLLNE